MKTLQRPSPSSVAPLPSVRVFAANEREPLYRDIAQHQVGTIVAANDERIRSADAALERLRPFVNDERVVAVVVCEPSCLSAIKDDWLQLKLKTPLPLRQ